VSDIELGRASSLLPLESIPDEELLAVAERGGLSDPSMMERQVRRMLPIRLAVLVKNFAANAVLAQYPGMQPDVTAFNYFDDNLRRRFPRKPSWWSKNEMRDDRSVVNLLKTDYPSSISVWQALRDPGHLRQRVSSNRGVDSKRQGLLGHASLMAGDLYPIGRPRRYAESGCWSSCWARRRRRARQVSGAEGGGGRKGVDHACRMEEHRNQPPVRRWPRIMTRSALRWENFTVSASGATPMWDSNDGAIDSSGVLPDGTAVRRRWVCAISWWARSGTCS